MPVSWNAESRMGTGRPSPPTAPGSFERALAGREPHPGLMKKGPTTSSSLFPCRGGPQLMIHSQGAGGRGGGVPRRKQNPDERSAPLAHGLLFGWSQLQRVDEYER